MRATSRGRNGRWTKSSDNEKEVVQQQNFVTPSPRRVTPKEDTTHIQEDRWISAPLTKLKPQRKDLKDMEGIAKKVYSYALACSWAISALRMVMKGGFLILALLLFRSAAQDNGVRQIQTTLGRCITDAEGTCYSKFQEDFFANPRPTDRYWLICQVSDVNNKDAYPHQLQIPLFSDNPVRLIIAFVLLIIVYWILGYVYDLLIDVTTIAAPHLSPRRA